MTDIVYSARILHAHRVAEIDRENQLMVAHRDRGLTLTPPRGRRLAAWFRSALLGPRRRAAFA
ncbi:hypothetical protein ACFT30_11335 [Microbacterium ureisolvens]|uniref:hypothetical protein n=1 Tax=Microbacterium ureisolvens TaxID=2781186 RepID=UPI00363FED5E